MPTVFIPRRYAPARPALPPPRRPAPQPPAPPARPGLVARWKTAWLLECARILPSVVLMPKPRVSRRF